MAQNSNFTGKKKTQVKNSFGDLDMIDPNKKKPKEEEQKPKKSPIRRVSKSCVKTLKKI